MSLENELEKLADHSVFVELLAGVRYEGIEGKNHLFIRTHTFGSVSMEHTTRFPLDCIEEVVGYVSPSIKFTDKLNYEGKAPSQKSGKFGLFSYQSENGKVLIRFPYKFIKSIKTKEGKVLRQIPDEIEDIDY
jgi:hypothetical protein